MVAQLAVAGSPAAASCGPASGGDGCVGGGNGLDGKPERQMRGEVDLVGPGFHAWRVSFPLGVGWVRLPLGRFMKKKNQN